MPRLKDQVWTAVSVEVKPRDVEVVSALLFAHECLGTEEIPAGMRVIVRAYFEEGGHEGAVQMLKARGYEPALSRIPYGDWAEGWKKHFVPTRVGERIVVLPSWETFEAGDRDVIVTVDPGIAFGTGTHETTRLCLAAIERHLTENPGASVLDVGTGTAILSIAAVKLGAAQPVTAIDIDEDALEAARENVSRNVEPSAIALSNTPLEALGTFDLVVANILADILLGMSGDLIDRVAPGGTLILSGILATQRAEIESAFAGPLELVHSESIDPPSGRDEDRWVLLWWQRRG